VENPALRRFTRRSRLKAPVAAALGLCGGESVEGIVVDEQPQGLGLVFRGNDAQRLAGHVSCCVGGVSTLRLLAIDAPEASLQVVLVHATPTAADGRRVRAGVTVEIERMRPAEVEHLLAVWHRLGGAGAR
jgi:hypothetical protein